MEDEIVFHDMKAQAPALGVSRPLSVYCQQYQYQDACATGAGTGGDGGNGGGGVDRSDSGFGGGQQAGVQFAGGSRPVSPSSPLFITQQAPFGGFGVGVGPGRGPGSSRPGSPSYNPLGAAHPLSALARSSTPAHSAAGVSSILLYI